MISRGRDLARLTPVEGLVRSFDMEGSPIVVAFAHRQVERIQRFTHVTLALPEGAHDKLCLRSLVCTIGGVMASASDLAGDPVLMVKF